MCCRSLLALLLHECLGAACLHTAAKCCGSTCNLERNRTHTHFTRVYKRGMPCMNWPIHTKHKKPAGCSHGTSKHRRAGEHKLLHCTPERSHTNCKTAQQRSVCRILATALACCSLDAGTTQVMIHNARNTIHGCTWGQAEFAPTPQRH